MPLGHLDRMHKHLSFCVNRLAFIMLWRMALHCILSIHLSSFACTYIWDFLTYLDNQLTTNCVKYALYKVWFFISMLGTPISDEVSLAQLLIPFHMHCLQFQQALKNATWRRTMFKCFWVFVNISTVYFTFLLVFLRLYRVVGLGTLNMIF